MTIEELMKIQDDIMMEASVWEASDDKGVLALAYYNDGVMTAIRAVANAIKKENDAD